MDAPKGPPPQEAIDRTIAWAQSHFAAYYQSASTWLPPRFGRREFGFLWIGQKFFFRHTGFATRDDLREFLARRAPAHAYHSVAYYQNPNAPTMKEKGWLGADLVFDLDADHLPEVKQGRAMTFEEQLVAVKREAVKLLEDFVLRDLGFDADRVRVVFSGGRGYHIHVDDPRVQRLGSAERREIVDYVTGLGLDPARFRRETTTERSEFAGHVSRKKRVELPPADAPGWGGRTTRATHAALLDLTRLDTASARRKLMDLPGVGTKTADAFLDVVAQRDAAGETMLDRLRRGDASRVVDVLGDRALTEQAVQAVNDERGEADEPVTADVKRLIRLPESLHGKTGLRVVRIEPDRLREFDPLVEAVAFGTEPVEVSVSKPERVRFADETFEVEPGRRTVPLRLALFLALRRKALLPW